MHVQHMRLSRCFPMRVHVPNDRTIFVPVSGTTRVVVCVKSDSSMRGWYFARVFAARMAREAKLAVEKCEKRLVSLRGTKFRGRDCIPNEAEDEGKKKSPGLKLGRKRNEANKRKFHGNGTWFFLDPGNFIISPRAKHLCSDITIGSSQRIDV